MAVLFDTRCDRCSERFEDVWSDEPKPVCCGEQTRRVIHVPHTNEWGGPRQYLHLRDEPFASRGELEKWTREQGMTPSGSNDKHGGARNEDHLNVGKIYG